MISKPEVLSRKRLQPLILAKFYGFDPEMDIDWEVLAIGCQAQRDKDWKEMLEQILNWILQGETLADTENGKLMDFHRDFTLEELQVLQTQLEEA